MQYAITFLSFNWSCPMKFLVIEIINLGNYIRSFSCCWHNKLDISSGIWKKRKIGTATKLKLDKHRNVRRERKKISPNTLFSSDTRFFLV